MRSLYGQFGGDEITRTSRFPLHRVHTGVLVLVVLTAGAYLPSPLYPAYQQALGYSDLTTTLLYAVFAVVSAPALLLFGSASDAVGPRPVLLTSIAAAAAGSLCFALATDETWLLAGRVLQAVALGAATGAASTLIGSGDSGGPSRRGTVLASSAFVAGTALGPALAGAVAQFLPGPRVLPFVIHLVLLWWAWVEVAALPPSPVGRVRSWRPTLPRVPAEMRGGFASAAAIGFVAWGVIGLFLSVVPSLLTRSGESNVAVIGGTLGVVLVCSVLAQQFVTRLGVRRAQLLGLAGLLLSLLVLAIGSIPLTLSAAVVAGVGHGLAYGGAAGSVERRAPAGQHGAITGALYVAYYLGAGLPAVAVGLVTLTSPLTVATTWVCVVLAALVPFLAASVLHDGVRARRAAVSTWSGQEAAYPLRR